MIKKRKKLLSVFYDKGLAREPVIVPNPRHVCVQADGSKREKSMTVFSKEEWERLVRKYERPLVGYFRVITGCSEEEAQDLVQNTWEIVFKRYAKDPDEGGYDPRRAGFYTYVKKGFACYIALRARRRRYSSRELPLDDLTWGEGNDQLAASDDTAPDSIMIEAERDWEQLSAALELFRRLFLCGGYPHQQLAFGYSQLIYGRPSNRGIEGNAARVDDECGSKPLKALTENFRRDYLKESGIDDPSYAEQIKNCLQPLFSRMPLPVAELVALDPVSKARFSKINSRKVAHTCLRDYYADHKKGSAKAIPDWCYRVSQRLFACCGTEPAVKEKRGDASEKKRIDACRRCKLRHLPPCKTDFAEPQACGGQEKE